MDRALAALALAAGLASVAPAFAGDAPESPAHRLARDAVEKQRGDGHRENMRVVWPDLADAPPPDGAEVVLIDGYICYRMTRLAWHDGRVAARSVTAARSWFYNKAGESYAADEFDVTPDAFANAWQAARLVLGARDERVAPESAGEHAASGGGGSHETKRWLRLTDPAQPLPFAADAGGHGVTVDGVRDWDSIRRSAAWDVLAALCPTERRRAAPVADWAPFVTAEVARAASRASPMPGDRSALFLEVALRVLGESGGEDAIEPVAALDAKCAHGPGDLHDEAFLCLTKLGLRHQWKAENAKQVLRETPRDKNWQDDLAKWVRARWAAADRDGYVRFVTEEIARGEGGADYLYETIREGAALTPPLAANAFHGCLGSADPYVRVEAAETSLARDASDATALAALRRVADDRTIEAPFDYREDWSRVRALRELVRLGAIEAKSLRARFDEPALDHAFVLATIVDLLRGAGAGPTPDELRALWRRVLDGPTDKGVRFAITTLIELRATESYDRIDAVLDAASKAAAEGRPFDRDFSEIRAEHLRDALREARAPTAPPK